MKINSLDESENKVPGGVKRIADTLYDLFTYMSEEDQKYFLKSMFQGIEKPEINRFISGFSDERKDKWLGDMGKEERVNAERQKMGYWGVQGTHAEGLILVELRDYLYEVFSLEKKRLSDDIVNLNVDELKRIVEEAEKNKENSKTMEKRAKIIGTVGLVTTILSMIKGDSAYKNTEEPEKSKYTSETNEIISKIEEELPKIIKEVEEENPELSDKEKSLKALNYFMTGNFVYGVSELTNGKAIPMGSYYVLAGGLQTKYYLSNDEEKHHLIDELKTNKIMTAIISSMIILSDGMSSDITERFDEECIKKGIKLDDKRKIVFATLLASGLAPGTTTLGASGATKGISHELVESIGGNDENKKNKIRSSLIAHISNISGLLFFGDPPFLAVIKKYGFVNTIQYQAKITWPLAFKSIWDTTYNLLKEIDPQITKKEVYSLLIDEDTLDFLGKELIATYGNLIKNLGTLGIKKGDGKRGVQSDFGGELIKKGKGFKKLFMGEIVSHGEGGDDMPEGEITKFDEAIRSWERIFIDLSDNSELSEEKDPLFEVVELLQDENWNELNDKLLELEKDDKTKAYAKLLRDDLDEIHNLESQSDDDSRVDIKNLWDTDINWGTKLTGSLKGAVTNTFSIKRAQSHGALGHNLTDVLNVFTWQTDHGPFLAEVLAEGLDLINDAELIKSIENKTELGSEAIKDILIYISIWSFSSVADNYLGCDLGLKLLPNDKSAISIIASIFGGKNTPIGNMANLNLFGLDESGFVEHMQATFGTQIGTDVFAMIYSIIISKFKFFAPPEVEEEIHKTNELTRRGFLQMLSEKAA